MTAPDPEASLALAVAATPGPWIVDKDEPAVWTSGETVMGGTVAYINYDQETGDHHPRGDAEFIAHAREAVPEMAEALIRISAVHQQVEELVNASIVARRCAHDRERWPCTTQRALQGIEVPAHDPH